MAKKTGSVEPSPVSMVFVHLGPGPHEVPGFGVFESGQTTEFPNQAAADAAYETGWFAPAGGTSKRGLTATQEVTE